MTERSTGGKLAVLFVHGVGIREPDYAGSAIKELRREFARSTKGSRRNNLGFRVRSGYGHVGNNLRPPLRHSS